MHRRLLAIAIVAAAAAAVRPAAAQADREVVLQQLDLVTEEKRRDGYLPAPRVFDGRSLVGMLPRDGAVVLEVNLRAGTRYFVAGGCDRDCEDMDLRIHSPDGRETLAEDVEPDDVPILSFTATETGPHLLTVVMATCRTDFCYFGVRVLAR